MHSSQATNPIDSIEDLNCQDLTSLDLFKCPISNLEPLFDSPIEELNPNGTSIRSRHLPKPIEKTRVAGHPSKRSFLLDRLPLEVLHLPGSPIETIAPLRYLPLKEMNLIGLYIEDLGPTLHHADRTTEPLSDKPTDEQFEFLRGIEFEA